MSEYDMTEKVIHRADGDDRAVIDMNIEAGDDCVELYAEALDDETGEVTSTAVRLDEAELVALIEAAERALDIIRDNS